MKIKRCKGIDKLSYQQRLKVENMIPSDWHDVSVAVLEKDVREGSQYKLNYGCIRIDATRCGKPVFTTVSCQCSGKDK